MSGNKPTHLVYLVDEMPDDEGGTKDRWTPIGAAWPHGDDQGFNIKLNGRLVLRERREQANDGEAQQAAE